MTETVKPGDELKISYKDQVMLLVAAFFFQVPQFPDGFSYLEREVWGWQNPAVGFWPEGGGIKVWWWQLTKSECPQDTELDLSFWEG